MEENITQQTVESKMSYTELENTATQLSQQVQYLYNKLKQSELSNLFKRLEYLFKVVELKSSFPNDFTELCVQEIVDIMSIQPEENTENKDE